MRALETRGRELSVRERACQIELGLKQRDLRRQHVGVGGHAGPESLGEHASGLSGGRTPPAAASIEA